MIELAKKDFCTGCAACAAVCAKGCITMQFDEEGFLFPRVDATRCVECKKCVQGCPVNKENGQALQKTLAVQSHSESLRKESSSGGVFTLLAQKIFAQDGVVFGSAWTDELLLEHRAAHNEEELKPLRGSKYLQSNIEESHRQVKAALAEGKRVLFVGTGCQVRGLKSYLGKDDENLLCADVVCHGAPSPGVWKERMAELESGGKKLAAVSFRDKASGWRRYSVSYHFEDGSVQSIPSGQEPFMKGFIADLYLRRSCHHCDKSCGSDLTLGDCWGLENLAPEMDDELGTSVVLIRTEKGRKAFEELDVKSMPIDYEQACVYNPAICRGAKENPKRKRFFAMKDKPLSQRVAKLTGVGFITKLKRKIFSLPRRVWRRIFR